MDAPLAPRAYGQPHALGQPTPVLLSLTLLSVEAQLLAYVGLPVSCVTSGNRLR